MLESKRPVNPVLPATAPRANLAQKHMPWPDLAARPSRCILLSMPITPVDCRRAPFAKPTPSLSLSFTTGARSFAGVRRPPPTLSRLRRLRQSAAPFLRSTSRMMSGSASLCRRSTSHPSRSRSRCATGTRASTPARPSICRTPGGDRRRF